MHFPYVVTNGDLMRAFISEGIQIGYMLAVDLFEISLCFALMYDMLVPALFNQQILHVLVSI